MVVMINITAVQLAYLAIVTMRGLHPISLSLLNMKNILGYNYDQLIPEGDEMENKRAEAMGFSHHFANNFNIMLMAQLLVAGLTGLTYLATSGIYGIADTSTAATTTNNRSNAKILYHILQR